jgi:hypothetical protein
MELIEANPMVTPAACGSAGAGGPDPPELQLLSKIATIKLMVSGNNGRTLVSSPGDTTPPTYR